MTKTATTFSAFLFITLIALLPGCASKIASNAQEYYAAPLTQETSCSIKASPNSMVEQAGLKVQKAFKGYGIDMNEIQIVSMTKCQQLSFKSKKKLFVSEDLASSAEYILVFGIAQELASEYIARSNPVKIDKMDQLIEIGRQNVFKSDALAANVLSAAGMNGRAFGIAYLDQFGFRHQQESNFVPEKRARVEMLNKNVN